jgi:hypothetical protein
MGRDSSDGIATGYGLDGPGDRIPVGVRFFAHVQTGPGAHPASWTMSTGSFSGRGADHPPLLALRSRMSSAIPFLPLWVCYRANFFIFLTLLTEWYVQWRRMLFSVWGTEWISGSRGLIVAYTEIFRWNCTFDPETVILIIWKACVFILLR